MLCASSCSQKLYAIRTNPKAGLTSKRQQQLVGLDMPGRFYFSQQQPNPLIIVQCLGRQQLTPLLFT
jgi:hypothetical protein